MLSLAKLTVASNNAKETIGQGLVEALMTITNSNTTDEFIGKIDKAAQSIANFARETGEFIKITKSIFDFKNLSFFAPSGGLFGDGKGFGNISMSVSSQDTQRADAIARKNATAITKLTKEQAAAQAKILKDKRLGAAIDKANLALNKGESVFDMDKIQLAAALTSQAEQLGRATSSAQKLQIANDVARLNVKKSILDLEDAIASKDEQAIIKATEKLNADLKILSTLSGQSVKLSDIKSILDSLKPKDLINQANLDAALAKIADMIKLLAQAGLAANAPIPRSGSLGSGIPEGDYIAPVSMTDALAASTDSLLELSAAVQERADAFSMLLDLDTEEKTKALAESSLAMTTGTQLFNIEDVARRSLLAGLSGGAGVSGAVSGSRYAAQAAAQYNITIQTGVGDPNAIAEAIDNVLREARDRGTLTAV